MFNIKKGSLLIQVIVIVMLLDTGVVSAQISHPDSFISLSSVANTVRIANDTYRILSYQKKGPFLSDISLLNRRVEHLDI